MSMVVHTSIVQNSILPQILSFPCDPKKSSTRLHKSATSDGFLVPFRVVLAQNIPWQVL
jgi:hypothetical protein